MWNVRELCAIVMYPNAQKELAGEAPHLEHHRTHWKSNEITMKKLQFFGEWGNFVL